MSVYPTSPAPTGQPAVRPTAWLYGVAALIALIAIGLAVGSVAVTRARAPTLTELGLGVQTVRMTSEEPKWFYVSKPKRLIPPPCQLIGAGDVQIQPLRTLPTLEQDGTTWYALARVTVSEDGKYGLACTGTPGGIRMAIGGEPNAPGLLGSVLLRIVVPILGVLAAVALCLVTYLRRRASRLRSAPAGTAPPAGAAPEAYAWQPAESGPAYPPQPGYPDTGWAGPPDPGSQPYPGNQPGYGDQGWGNQQGYADPGSGYPAQPGHADQGWGGQPGYHYPPGQEPPTEYWNR